jgi:Zn-dependent peptidase ImmA (M78 family)/transcriptional regulator with XRE-family HTH domain
MEILRLKSSGAADATELSNFNPKRFALARKRRGFTMTELAKKLDVTPRTISAYESGENPPLPDIFAKFPAILGFPSAFFLGDDLESLPVEAVSFRSLLKMTAKHREIARSQGELAVYLSKWLDGKFALPACELPDDLSSETSPEAAAEYLRDIWSLGQQPIRNMIHLLESKGVRVFSIAVEAREVDAFSAWNGATPFIFLNSYKSAERSRFDAAHELGHLILHKHGAPQGRQAELDANRFAAAFLMPKAGVLASAPKFVTLPELRVRKKFWNVALAALNHRLYELEYTPEWQYQHLCVEISKRGYRTHEPDGSPRETSLVLPQLFASLLKEDKLSRARIAEELQIPLSELENLLFSMVMTSISGGRRATNPVGNPNLTRVK